MILYYLVALFLQVALLIVNVYSEIFLRNKGYSFSLIGLILALGQIVSIIVPIFVAAKADKRGKSKGMILICSLGSVLFAIPVLLSGSVALTIICFILLSAFFYCQNPLTDGLLNRYNSGHPGRYSYMRAMGTLGYVVFLVLFAILKFPNPEDNRSILLTMAVSSIPFWLFVAILPEKKYPKAENELKNEPKEKFFDIKWFSKPVYIFTFIVALTRISETVVDKLFPSYMTEVLNLGSNFTLVYAISGFSEFLMMIFGGRLLEKRRITPLGLLTVSCVALAIRLLIYYLFPSVTVVFFAQILHAFSFGGIHIAAAAYYNQHVDKKHSALAMSMYWTLANYFPQMIGSLAGGVVIDKFGYPILFLSYSVFSIIAFVLCLFFRKTLAQEDL